MEETVSQLDIMYYQIKFLAPWVGYVLLSHWPKGSHIPHKQYRLLPMLLVNPRPHMIASPCCCRYHIYMSLNIEKEVVPN